MTKKRGKSKVVKATKKKKLSWIRSLSKLWQSKVFRFVVKFIFAVIVLICCIAAVFFAYCLHDIPDLSKLSEDNAKPHIIIRSDDNRILSHYGDIYGRSLKYEQLPKHLIKAVLAIEDRKFFEHDGIDYLSIIRALIKNTVVGKTVQGGSTITQQLAKIIFLSADRTIKRKIQEAVLAVQIEKLFSKEQIITIYLNRVFLGHGNYGIDAAARNYFAKKTENLTLYEAAFIAGMLKAPSKYAPPNGTELALKRAKQVLASMLDSGLITKRQMEYTKPPVFINSARPRGLLIEQFFSDHVLSVLPQLIYNVNQDLDIRSTLSLDIQEKLEKAMTNVLQNKTANLSKEQLAVVVMKKNGDVKAMMGGRKYKDSQFNRAVFAKRQPGSLFKLFVYIAALENGYKFDTIVEDSAFKVAGWQPRNFSREYRGKMSLMDAFAYSVNTIAVKLNEKVGRQRLIKVLERFGIESEMRNTPSIALGTSEMTLLELVRCYAVIANNGKMVRDNSVLSIADNQKRLLYRHSYNDVFSNLQIIDTKVLEQIKDMLMASVMYGTSKNAQVPGKNIYGKTGTSQDYRDAWFIGIVDDMIVGVWIGNDGNQPMRKITGGGGPAMIFKELLLNISKNAN